MGALGLAASKRKVTLPDDMAVDAEINLGVGDGGFLLSARFNVSLPGLERKVAEELTQDAHGICPYSKATHGNIAVETTVVV